MNATPPRSSRSSKTSIDILHERDALAARLTIVNAVLKAIGAEAQHALSHPEISLMTLCRIETLVSQSVDEAPASGVRLRKTSVRRSSSAVRTG